jgi:signal transduction histidine kinase/CHASE2 domain-containing sensor protein
MTSDSAGTPTKPAAMHAGRESPRRAGAWRRAANLELVIFGVLMVMVTMAVIWTGGLIKADRMVRDLLVAANARPPNAEIVVVAIDEASLRALGRWPWRRAVHALALDRIDSDGPKAIGLDILIGDRQSQGEEPEDALADAIRRSGRVVLPVWAASSDVNQLVKPLPELTAAAAALGHVNQPVDTDGIVRFYDGHLRLGTHAWMHFASAMQRVARRDPRGAVPVAAELKGGPLPLSVTTEPIRQVSYVDVLRGQLPAGTFAGKYVLIGVTAAGLGPAYALPEFRQPRLVPGVELVALALQDVLQPQPLRDAPMWMDVIFSLLILIAVILILGVVSPSRMLVALLCTVLLVAIAAFGMAAKFSLLTRPATAVVVGLVTYPLWSWRKLDLLLSYLGRESKRIQSEWSADPEAAARAKLSNGVESRIDELETATGQLRKLHRFISGILLGLPDSSLVVDARGRIELANLEAARYFGHQIPSGLIGLSFDGLMADTLLPDKSQAAISMAAMPAPGQMLNLEAMGRNGRELLIRCVPFKQAAHPLENSWIVTLVDVFELRCAERTRDEAFSFISHDMRSPQASILALLELRRLNKLQVPDADFLKKIEDYARSALQLSEDFVFSARARTAPYLPQLVDLADLCANAVDDVWPQAQAKQIAIGYTVPDEPAFCDGEVGLIRRALNNLLVNAIKYSPPGGRVQCELTAHETWWVVAVRDNGPGIAPAQRITIFERYSQADASPRLPSGVGLGLDFVRIVARRHGGDAGVENQSGGGSVFHIRLRQAEVPSD